MISSLINKAQSYLGVRQGDSRHKELIQKYNRIKPVPMGYLMKESDDWCATFLTVMADLAGCSKYIGRECGVHRFTQIFKKKKIWIGVEKPKRGDIVVFDWRKNGWMDHIGIVEKFSANKITVIEGNSSQSVARRVYNWNDWRVSGYARPNYPLNSVKKGKKLEKLIEEVIAGKWGNGEERREKLKKAGYDVKEIQKEVNKKVKVKKKTPKSNKSIVKEVVRGDWGNGNERRKALEKAGYDYQKIQKIVNQLS